VRPSQFIRGNDDLAEKAHALGAVRNYRIFQNRKRTFEGFARPLEIACLAAVNAGEPVDAGQSAAIFDCMRVRGHQSLEPVEGFRKSLDALAQLAHVGFETPQRPVGQTELHIVMAAPVL